MLNANIGSVRIDFAQPFSLQVRIILVHTHSHFTLTLHTHTSHSHTHTPHLHIFTRSGVHPVSTHIQFVSPGALQSFLFELRG